jgi:hypothetical protein
MQRTHRVFIEHVCADRVAMHYEGELIGYSNWPIYVAAALLADRGVDPLDIVETWRHRENGDVMCLRGVIGEIVIEGIVVGHLWAEGISPQQGAEYADAQARNLDRRTQSQVASLQP